MRVTSATTLTFNRLLIASLFIEVRELVGTQQHFTTLCNCFMTSFVALIHSSLNSSCFQCRIEATCFFYSKEEFPSLFCNSHSQILDIIRTGSRVDHFIKMRFFFQQQLLVTSQAF